MGKQILPLCCWLLVGITPFFSYAQEWNWIQSAGEPAGDPYNYREKGHEIAVTPDGNFLVIGSFEYITTLGDTSLINVETEGFLDFTDLFVGKLDSLGNWLWVTQVPGNFYGGYIHYYRLFGLDVDSDGNAYISGGFYNSATLGNTELTGEGIFVAKLNSEGAWQWAEGGFFTNDVHCYSISVTDDQQVFITGAYSGAGGFGNVAVTGPPKGIFVAKFDADGNCLWAKGAGDANFGGSGRDVATDQAGNVYVSATLKAPAIIDDTISLTGTYTETQDYLCVFKLDGDGHFQWSNVATHCTQPICLGREIIGYSLDVSADGSRVYVGGTMDGRTTFYFGPLSAGGYGIYDFGAIFVAALDGSGQWDWVRTAGGPGVNAGSNFGIDEVFDLRVNEMTSQVFVTGYFANSPYAYFGNIYFSGNDLSVSFVAALSGSGQWQWVLEGPVAKGTGIDLLPEKNMGFITGTIGWECLVARFCLPRNYYYDMDGDGFGNPAESVFQCDPGDSWVTNNEDCNDLDDAINPLAPEVCNGRDDNCDGAVDEGTEGTVHAGNVFFDNQDQVEQWLSCFAIIDGDLTVMGNVKSLGPLKGLLEVTGSIFIMKSSLTGMEGLDSLHTVGGDLVIWKNRKLTTLAGLGRLDLIRGDLQILSNSRLWDCCPIEILLQSEGILGAVKIHQNDTSCESVPAILTACGDLEPQPVWIGNDITSESRTSVWVLELYPNPVRKTLHLSLYAPAETALTLSVLDLNGRTLYLDQLTAPEGVSDLTVPETEKLAPGMYSLVLRAGEAPVVVKRFLKI